jgi:tungstate transport system substrate-binding protein
VLNEREITMSPWPRRQPTLRRAGTRLPIALLLLLTLGGLSAPPEVGAAAVPEHRSSVRLLTVGAALTGGMLADLVADFEEESGYRVTVSAAGEDIFDQARAGEADLVMAHLGFTELQDFVSEGRGRWPATVLANTVAFIIPPSDPAGVREVDDPVEAFRLIADHRSPFIVNDLGETRYTDTLWNATGRPDKQDWFLDLGLSGAAAVREAERRDGYTLWGLRPFLMLQQPQPLDLEPEVFDDSLLQRIIASVVVELPPGKVNERGADALQRYLVDPATQASIRSFRLPGIDRPVFWPAGNQNDN